MLNATGSWYGTQVSNAIAGKTDTNTWDQDSVYKYTKLLAGETDINTWDQYSVYKYTKLQCWLVRLISIPGIRGWP